MAAIIGHHAPTHPHQRMIGIQSSQGRRPVRMLRQAVFNRSRVVQHINNMRQATVMQHIVYLIQIRQRELRAADVAAHITVEHAGKNTVAPRPLG